MSIVSPLFSSRGLVRQSFFRGSFQTASASSFYVQTIGYVAAFAFPALPEKTTCIVSNNDAGLKPVYAASTNDLLQQGH